MPPTDPEEDAADYPSLREDFITYVRGHSALISIGGLHVVAAFMLFRLERWLDWESFLLLWMEAPVLAACLWMWRRQFVPVRWHGEVIRGPRARRWAVGIAVASLALGWVQITADRHQRAIRETLASEPPPVSPHW